MSIADELRRDADAALREDGMYYSGEYLSGIAKRVEDVEAENKRLLRELVRIAINYCDSGTCDGCPIQGESGWCPYSDMARKLGIEVSQIDG